MLMVMIEHIILVLKYALRSMIPDKPSWVLSQEAEFKGQWNAVSTMLELRKEEYRAQGEIPLKDVIRGIKTENKKKAELKHAEIKSRSSNKQEEENITQMERLKKKKQTLNAKIGI